MFFYSIFIFQLIKLAKKFKKEKVDCDVICFGEADSENVAIMTQFVDTLNGKSVLNHCLYVNVIKFKFIFLLKSFTETAQAPTCW